MRLVLAVAVVLTLARGFALHLDPPVTKRLGDVANEGYWLHNARIKALTGEFRLDPFTQALVTAPVYTALAYGVFAVNGVSLASGRRLAALSGMLIIATGVLFLWRRGNPRWAAAFALLLAINDLFFAYNRLGLVETTLTLFLFVSFLALATALDSPRRTALMAVSGVAFGLALLCKFTALYVLASFALIPVVEWLAGRRIRLRDGLVWVAGAVASTTPVLATLEWRYPGELARFVTIYSSAAGQRNAPGLLVGVLFNPLRVVQNEFVSAVSVMLLSVVAGAGLVSLVRRHGLRGALTQLTTVERVCVAWIVGNVVTSAMAELQADRRYWSLLVPLTVLAARVIARVFAPRLATVVRETGTTAGPFGAAPRAVLTVLSAYATAPLLALLVGHLAELTGLRLRLGISQGLCLLAVAAVAWWMMGSRRRWLLPALFVVPLVFFGIDGTLVLILAGTYARTLATALVIAAVSVVVVLAVLRLSEARPRPVFVGLLVAYLVWTAGAVGTTFATPATTVYDAAHAIDRLIRTEVPDGRYFVAGANVHELALESQSFPLFLGIGKFFTELSRGLIGYPHAPAYFIHVLPAAGGISPLPAGMEGTEMGRYCMYENRRTGYCRYPVAVIRLTRFSLAEFLASEKTGQGEAL